MKIQITAGETFEAQCPAGQRPIVKIGEKLPNAEKALAKVIKLEKGVVTLGPFKTGAYTVQLPCDVGNFPIEVEVKELSPQLAQKRFSPLSAQSVEYPLSLFLVVLAILCALIAGVLYAYFRKQKKVETMLRPKAKRDARVELEKTLSFLETNVANPENHHFHDLYKGLRRFIEAETKLQTRSLTTGEFLGTFRALALQQSTNQNLLSQLEYVLKTADDVRFAGKDLSAPLWQDYLKKVRGIVTAFPKPEPVPTKKVKGAKAR